MIRNLFIPISAVCLFLFAVAHALYVQRPEPKSAPPVMPPVSPFGNTVAGAGIVEPATEASGSANIAIGSQLSGVVARVHVRIGEQVRAGDLLLELDQRQARAELKARQANLLAMQAQLRRLQLQPRPEELPVSEAQVAAANADLHERADQRDRNEELIAKGAVSREELVRTEQGYQTSHAQLGVAQANLALLKAGAWEPDKAIAAANVELAEAQVAQASTNLELLQIRAPVDGTILQINVRPGEFVSTGGAQSLILMGNLDSIHIRVNIDQEDIPRLTFNAPAVARIRGDSNSAPLSLTFVRLEPFVVPKTSLTGANIERVDTRVVQLIYAADPHDPLVRAHKVLVGQLVDVFIDTKARPKPESSITASPGAQR